MKFILASMLLLISAPGYAAWLEASGKIESIATYASNETILVTLSSPGKAVPACSNTTTFAISRSISAEARARMFSMLLAARAAGANITVAFDEAGGCEPWDANTNVYRIIKRMR